MDQANEPQLHVIGVGYGRTGTDSLREALNILGYRTFHTKEMFENDHLFRHFDDKVFRFDLPQLRQPDLGLVARSGFNATMDMPMSLYYRQLFVQYPAAKFILSVRNSPDVWMQSWCSLIDTVSLLPRFAPFFPKAFMFDRYQRWLMAILHNDERFLRIPHPQVTAAQDHRAIESYKAHNDGVRRLIPREQLLEINLSDGLGWAPLCDFLEVSAGRCPGAQGLPFPRVNSQAQVRTQLQTIVVGANAVLLVVLFLVFRLVRFAVGRFGIPRGASSIAKQD